MKSTTPRAPAGSAAGLSRWGGSARGSSRERVITCALITHAASAWFTDALLTAPGLRFVAPDPRLLLADGDANPYQLVESDAWDVAIINIEWLKWRAASGVTELDASLVDLRRRSAAVVGLEGYDGFSLATPPAILDRLDLLIKAQGLFRDRALYNWRVGPYYPGGVWAARLHRRRVHYSDKHLSKLRLSVPCFLYVDRRARHAVRAIKPGVSPAARTVRRSADLLLALAARAYRTYPRRAGSGAHFTGTLTHLQRAQLVEAMSAAGVRGTFGITGVHESYFGGPLCKGAEALPHDEHEDCRGRNAAPSEMTLPGAPPFVSIDGHPILAEPRSREEVLERLASHELLKPRVTRARFALDLLRHGVVLAPTGFGELTFRHGEALRSGRVLVCQDLSHVEMLFPLLADHNAVFCQPDLGDVVTVVAGLLEEPGRAQKIADTARRNWARWTRHLDDALRAGFTKHVAEAAGASSVAQRDRGTLLEDDRAG